MIQLKRSQEHTVDTLFILGLFVIFAATSFLVVFIGAKQYQNIVTRMDENFEIRGCTSYLEEKIRQNDSSNAVNILTIDGQTVLALTNIVNGTEYTTYIYTYEGSLREFYTASGTDFSLSDGQAILDATDFSAEFTSATRLKLTVTDLYGQTETLYTSLNADTFLSSN
ncbi:MAG: DUF4860 domain-containing protein [Roseburia sp.]